MGNKYVIEYSNQQKCFNVDTLENIILKNMKDFKNKNFANDYKIIKICDDLEIANKTIQELKLKGKIKYE